MAALALIGRWLLRSSPTRIERNFAIESVSYLNGFLCPTQLPRVSTAAQLSQFNQQDEVTYTVNRITLLYPEQDGRLLGQTSDQEENNSDSDEEYECERGKHYLKCGQRGDSEFWRRKMCTLHRVLDINRDGVISFDDFGLLVKRFTDLGHLSPAMSVEFLDVVRLTWEEQFGPITTYNLVAAEQFLTDMQHRLNDKDLRKHLGRFLFYLFKAVDYDHTGHLDLDQYKLFFHCLGLGDENAAVSFAVIDKNGDGLISLNEFVHLGRQFFLTEDETKISKFFWGPLINH
uniref:EF-hand domain-containing protein n=1 Tax=Glossina austeni TaxID=7395 RepID=A0A1A9VCS6_GLOAU